MTFRRGPPMRNVSARAHNYRSYIDECTWRLAEQMFADDLAAFGYAF